MASTTLRRRGQLTIPTAIRKAAGLAEGDPLAIELTADGILLRRAPAVTERPAQRPLTVPPPCVRGTSGILVQHYQW